MFWLSEMLAHNPGACTGTVHHTRGHTVEEAAHLMIARSQIESNERARVPKSPSVLSSDDLTSSY